MDASYVSWLARDSTLIACICRIDIIFIIATLFFIGVSSSRLFIGVRSRLFIVRSTNKLFICISCSCSRLLVDIISCNSGLASGIGLRCNVICIAPATYCPP